jgi:hypothetical protein
MRQGKGVSKGKESGLFSFNRVNRCFPFGLSLKLIQARTVAIITRCALPKSLSRGDSLTFPPPQPRSLGSDRPEYRPARPLVGLWRWRVRVLFSRHPAFWPTEAAMRHASGDDCRSASRAGGVEDRLGSNVSRAISLSANGSSSSRQAGSPAVVVSWLAGNLGFKRRPNWSGQILVLESYPLGCPLILAFGASNPLFLRVCSKLHAKAR